jgi:hypothetical protein
MMCAIKIYKKLVVVILVLTFLFSPIFKAHAQFGIVHDPVHTAVTTAQFSSEATKDYGLDTVAWFLANLVLERIGQATVSWINSGFQGKPAYVTDTGGFFTNVADQAAGQYIQNNTNFDFLCGPIRDKIRVALQTSYYGNTQAQWQCTLTDIAGNMEDFMGDFSRGSWSKFFELSQKRQNNPLGIYIQAESELYANIASELGKEEQKLNWGQGFLSQTKCARYGVPTTRVVTEGGKFELQPDGTSKYVEGTTRNVTDPAPCLQEEIITPGKVIEGQLNNVLGSGLGKLEAADEIDEIIGALLNQLIQKAVGATGLRG